jgi:hypothetical protein
MIRALRQGSPDNGNPVAFQNQMLRFCTPLPDVTFDVDPFETYGPGFDGWGRYAYQVNEGSESDLMRYLLGFNTGETTAAPVVMETANSEPSRGPQGTIKIGKNHFLSRVNQGARRRGVNPTLFRRTVETTVSSMVQSLTEARLTVGQVGPAWNASVPTHGIYAETMLGLCSGGEDYIEVNRQFDLELKKLDVEKSALDNERQRLRNANPSGEDARELIVRGEGTQPSTVNVTVQEGS